MNFYSYYSIYPLYNNSAAKVYKNNNMAYFLFILQKISDNPLLNDRSTHPPKKHVMKHEISAVNIAKYQFNLLYLFQRFLCFPIGKRTFPGRETYVFRSGNVRFRPQKHKK